MQVTIKTKRTSQFIDWWAWGAFTSFILIFVTLILSPMWQRTLLNETVTVDDEPAKLKPIELKPHTLGALRVDAEARINANEWVAFEIQLLDKAGKVIASGTKEGWSETGTWYEEGEYGSWAEQDTLGGLDVRAKQDETLTVALALLDYGTTEGKDLNQPVSFQVTVSDGIIDTGYLWLGMILSSPFALATMYAARKSGKRAIFEKIQDSDPTGRGILGGEKRLVRVRVEVEADETAPRQVEVRLVINDGYGEQIYCESTDVNVERKTKDGQFIKAVAKLDKFFVIPERNSYGFHVEVYPDAPIDRTKLIVRDGARTILPTDVIYLENHKDLAVNN
ncbi:hypothetical protein [Dulcicalothrix desertica]|nr:hypothetical protein [Dulcicalothrix desertica]TWH42581.1 hypothetical protein CAL7102_06250 [Dulcicalothrix desertica PCC 7102]